MNYNYNTFIQVNSNLLSSSCPRLQIMSVSQDGKISLSNGLVCSIEQLVINILSGNGAVINPDVLPSWIGFENELTGGSFLEVARKKNMEIFLDIISKDCFSAITIAKVHDLEDCVLRGNIAISKNSNDDGLNQPYSLSIDKLIFYHFSIEEIEYLANAFANGDKETFEGLLQNYFMSQMNVSSNLNGFFVYTINNHKWKIDVSSVFPSRVR